LVVALPFFLHQEVAVGTRKASVGLVEVGWTPSLVATLVMVDGIPIGISMVGHCMCWYFKNTVIGWYVVFQTIWNECKLPIRL